MDLLDTLQHRGLVQQITHPDELRTLLAEGKLVAYCGFDPTAASLHVGNLVPMMALRRLQQAGHTVVAVVGGGTAMVGDPSGKDSMRQMLTRERIAENKAAIRKQLERFLVLDGERGHLVDNADWLCELGYIDFLRDIGREFSVNRMLSAEAYKARMEKGLSFIEFNYQLLQAYDFLELYRRLGVTLQVGGDDQWGNIVAGIDLIRRKESVQAFALTQPLLTTSSGAKMGKTADGAVWLSAERFKPFDFFQYWYNVEDPDVGRFMRLYTDLPEARVAELESLTGADLRKAKEVLAWEITNLVHGAEAADEARKALRGDVEQLPELVVEPGVKVYAAMQAAGFAKSNGEGRRLIQGGGVKLDGDKVSDPEATVDTLGVVLRVGKKRFVRLIAG